MWDISSFCFFSWIFSQKKIYSFLSHLQVLPGGGQLFLCHFSCSPNQLSDLERGLSSTPCALKSWYAHRGEADTKTIQRTESRNLTCYFKRQRERLPSLSHYIERLYTPFVRYLLLIAIFAGRWTNSPNQIVKTL